MKKEELIEQWKKAAELQEKKVNPWAVCTSQVGRGDKGKYEKCVMDVKKSQK